MLVRTVRVVEKVDFEQIPRHHRSPGHRIRSVLANPGDDRQKLEEVALRSADGRLDRLEAQRAAVRLPQVSTSRSPAIL